MNSPGEPGTPAEIAGHQTIQFGGTAVTGEWRFADKDALIADISAQIRRLPGVPTNFSQVIEDNVEEALSRAGHS